MKNRKGRQSLITQGNLSFRQRTKYDVATLMLRRMLTRDITDKQIKISTNHCLVK